MESCSFPELGCNAILYLSLRLHPMHDGPMLKLRHRPWLPDNLEAKLVDMFGVLFDLAQERGQRHVDGTPSLTLAGVISYGIAKVAVASTEAETETES